MKRFVEQGQSSQKDSDQGHMGRRTQSKDIWSEVCMQSKDTGTQSPRERERADELVGNLGRVGRDGWGGYLGHQRGGAGSRHLLQE